MSKLFAAICIFCTLSCSTFSKYAWETKTEKCFDAYVCLINDSLYLKYQSYGGFKFADNPRAYRKIHTGKKPRFKNIIVYGQSKLLKGDYYLLLNNRKYPNTYQYKDTIINKKKITIALSRSVNYQTNTDFLLNFKLDK